MTIEKRYGKKAAFYAILDDNGEMLARFPTLAAAGIVRRFLSADKLTDAELVFAINCLNEYDAVNSGKKGEGGAA